jgi:hypothetical protein
MQFIWETLIVAAMFILRLGVPLTAIFFVGCALRRLDARWQAEAVARRQRFSSMEECLTSAATGRPVAAGAIIQEPCWEYRACPESMRARCPAYLAPQVPCWLARRREAGQLPSQCGRCSIFATARRIASGVAA